MVMVVGAITGVDTCWYNRVDCAGCVDWMSDDSLAGGYIAGVTKAEGQERKLNFMLPTAKIIAEHEIKIAKLGKVLQTDRDGVFDFMEKHPLGLDCLYKLACAGWLD